MKTTVQFILFISFLTVASISFGQAHTKNCNPTTTSIKGEYQSKNIFLQQTVENAILKISINGKEYKMAHHQATMEIVLSDLKVGQTFEIKIEYCEGKEVPYKILNPEVLK